MAIVSNTQGVYYGPRDRPFIKVIPADFEVAAPMTDDAAESDPECHVLGRSEAELSRVWARTNQI